MHRFVVAINTLYLWSILLLVLKCAQLLTCWWSLDMYDLTPVPQQLPRVIVFADCAVCDQGFAPATAYSCRECSSSSKKLAVGLSTLAAFCVTLVAALIGWRLGSVAREISPDDEEVARSSQDPKRWSCRTFPMRMLPLTAIKIVVTVWQILYQVCGCLYHFTRRWITSSRYAEICLFAWLGMSSRQTVVDQKVWMPS